MNVKARICKLEQAITPKRPEVFIYRPIVSPELKDESGPFVIGVTFHAGNELVHLDRGKGEILDNLSARMRVVVTEKSGAKVAIGLDEKARKLLACRVTVFSGAIESGAGNETKMGCALELCTESPTPNLSGYAI